MAAGLRGMELHNFQFRNSLLKDEFSFEYPAT